MKAFGIVWLFCLICLPCLSSRAAPIDYTQVRVIDGDTIRLDHKKPDIRLMGCNAPETKRGECMAEAEAGRLATTRVREIIRQGNLDFEYVPCPCPPYTEGTFACNLGRRCGILKSNGKDICQILIAEKLAVPFVCGRTSCPPKPHPWCEPAAGIR